MSLPTPTFIGQQETVEGKTYQAMSVNPPVWKAITTGTTKKLLSDHLTNQDGAHDEIYGRNFKTITDLRAQTDAGGQIVDLALIAGSKVFWRGYYAESDGGSNWGIVKTGDSTSLVDDGGSIFVIVNDAVNGVWVEANLKGKSVNVKKFGAGEGNLGSDDAIKINKCINYVSSNLKSGTVRFLAEKYNIQSTVYLAENVKYKGAGNVAKNFPENTGKGTILEWDGGVTTIIDDDATADNTSNWTTVDGNLTFNGSNYVMSYTANTQYIYKQVSALTQGKKYRFTFSIKDGTEQNVPVTAYVNTALGGAGAKTFGPFNTTDRWREYSFLFEADVANLTYMQLFSTLASGSYEIRDIFIVEVDTIVYAGNLQHESFEGITVVGNFTTTNRSAIIGIDIESMDSISQNSRRGTYREFGVLRCHTGVEMSGFVKDTGNTDGYTFEKFDILECYVCVQTYSRFIAYTKFVSGSISYYKYGIDFDRATGAKITDIAGYSILQNPRNTAAMFRITDASGVLTFIDTQSEYIAGQDVSKSLFALFEGENGADNFNCTNFVGNYIQQRIDIYNRNHNLNFVGNSISHDITLRSGSDGTVIQSVSNREYNGGGFKLDTGVQAYISRAAIRIPQETVTWNPPSIAAGSSVSQAFTIQNVSTRDYAQAAYSANLSGLLMSVEASSTNEVTITLFNPTAGAIDLAADQWYIQVEKNRSFI